MKFIKILTFLLFTLTFVIPFNAQNRVAIENSITAVGTKQLNVQNEILKTEQNIKDAEANIQKAETSAKELGINLPIAQYQKALEELKRNL